MNGIDKITERISEDIQQEIAAIEAESEKECEEIRQKYDTQAQDEYWKAVAKGKKAADIRRERMAGAAAMESKKQILALKQEAVARAFDLAVEKLKNLPEDKYVSLLAEFAARGAKSGAEQLIFSPNDRGHYGKKVCMAANELLVQKGRPGSLTLSSESRPIRGGVIVTDGLVDVNYSLEALVSARRNGLMEPVSKILFD